MFSEAASVLNEFVGFDVELFAGTREDPISEFSEFILKKSENGGLRNYVIWTDRPKTFSGRFISNNIVDVSDRNSFKSVIAETKWIFEKFGKERILPMQKIFITSDTHFWHKNIIRYCGRPWNSGVGEDGQMIVTDENVEQMNESMIEKWNSAVGTDDVVYHLGDVAFGDRTRIASIMERLNGRKRLVLGNHDSAPGKQDVVKFYMDSGFERVYDRSIIIQDFVVLSHLPLPFLSMNSPFYSCYGHVHNSGMFETWTKNSCCVCVERHDYVPVSLDTIKAKYEEMNR